ncbi:hypothetical protein PRIC1_010521 [Phytophthora ramorum]
MSSSSESMAFDGSSSDLARQLYYRAKAQDQVEQLALNAIPAGLQTRLDKLQLDWDKLPGIAQRALLWDSGFAVSADGDAIQIWTLGDHTMSTLALTADEYEAAGCVFGNCTEPDGTEIHINYHCNGAQMNRAAKCLAQEFKDDVSYNAAMWAIGGRASMCIPSAPIKDEPGYDSCPSTSSESAGYGSVVFPCQTTANFTSDLEKKTVVGSDWVSNWLVEDYPDAAVEDSNGFNKLLLVPIVLGALVVVALVALGFYCKRKRQQRARMEFEESTADVGQTPYLAPTPGDKNFDQRDTNARPTLAVSEDLTTSTYTGADHTIQFPVGYGGDYVSGGSNTTLKILLTSEHLVGKRIPLENLTFEKALSKGASGELEAKVIDFGVSRGRLDNTMTAGVGTPFWTAPEILEGKRYSEQADIYSFGVVLSELDTCKIPFHDCISSKGKKAKPFHILKEVMAGTLRPSFSADCPPRIRRVGVACCQQDPARRPTAAVLVAMLQGE